MHETLNEQKRTGGQMPNRKNHRSLSVGSESFTTHSFFVVGIFELVH